jgi:hypothetical protein
MVFDDSFFELLAKGFVFPGIQQRPKGLALICFGQDSPQNLEELISQDRVTDHAINAFRPVNSAKFLPCPALR